MRCRFNSDNVKKGMSFQVVYENSAVLSNTSTIQKDTSRWIPSPKFVQVSELSKPADQYAHPVTTPHRLDDDSPVVRMHEKSTPL